MGDDIRDALLDAPKETEAPTEAPEAEPEAAKPEVEPEGKPEPEVTPERAPDVEPEPEADKDDSQGADEIPSDLLMRAGELGLTEDAAKGMDADTLSTLLTAQDRRFIALGKSAVPTEKPPEPQPAPEVKPEPKAPEVEAPVEFEIPPELQAGGDVDPVVGNTIKTLADHFTAGQASLVSMVEGAVTEMREMMGSLVKSDQQNAVRVFNEEYEGVVGSMGSEWDEVFGKGDFRQLAPESEQLKNRMTLLKEVGALVHGYKAMGQDVRSIPMKTLVQRARDATFGDKLASVSRQKIAAQLKDRESAMLPRPKPRKSRNLSNDEEALVAIRKAMGKQRDRGDDSYKDALLDAGSP